MIDPVVDAAAEGGAVTGGRRSGVTCRHKAPSGETVFGERRTSDSSGRVGAITESVAEIRHADAGTRTPIVGGQKPRQLRQEPYSIEDHAVNDAVNSHNEQSVRARRRPPTASGISLHNGVEAAEAPDDRYGRHHPGDRPGVRVEPPQSHFLPASGNWPNVQRPTPKASTGGTIRGSADKDRR
ncbi:MULTISPECIES: hypothetical protein [unclassified Micromonospora]|uniref:hypothetical protein n=1 Tax=unclassified Micromonospora TaxID=2617518 RepID=UPI00248FB750|nr:hypothetical protein [Micromonospora sp. AKA38]